MSVIILPFLGVGLEIFYHYSCFCKTDEQNDVGAQSRHQIDKPQSSQNLDYEKEHKILKEKVKTDALEHKARPQEPTEVSGR